MKRSAQGILAFASVVKLLSGCGVDAEDELFEIESNKPKANLQIKDPRWLLGQTSTKAWSLDKTGSVDTVARTVTWNLVATQSATASRDLVLGGRVVLKNSGHAPATIGNIVIVLEKKSGNSWSPVSRVIANETQGDAATIAKIAKNTSQTETMVENAASEYLVASFAPVPAKGQRSLDFAATFDNDVLALLPGTKVRAKIYVTYGNAGTGPSNVDIDGNGSIGQDEQKVATESETFDDRTVPWPLNVNAQVELEDTLADITTTGTVTFSNAQFNLGATTGTVTVSYEGGTDGGTLENCGHLVGLGVDETDCDEQTIGADVAWRDGDVITYSQGNWGNDATAGGTLLANRYFDVYSTNGILEVGVAGATGRSIRFTGGDKVQTFLPSGGTEGVLAIDHVDPTPPTEAGRFASELVALTLNVDFSAAGITLGNRGVPFGDLVMCGVTGVADGTTVSGFLASANAVLGGTSTASTPAALTLIASDLNFSFNVGSVTDFARDHLAIGSCN